MLYTINVEVMACDTEFSALVVIITMPYIGKCNILSMCTAAFMAVDINPGIFVIMQACMWLGHFAQNVQFTEQ